MLKGLFGCLNNNIIVAIVPVGLASAKVATSRKQDDRENCLDQVTYNNYIIAYSLLLSIYYCYLKL